MTPIDTALQKARDRSGQLQDGKGPVFDRFEALVLELVSGRRRAVIPLPSDISDQRPNTNLLIKPRPADLETLRRPDLLLFGEVHGSSRTRDFIAMNAEELFNMGVVGDHRNSLPSTIEIP